MLCLVARKNFGEELRLKRMELGLTQADFAELLGTTRERYKNWEYSHAEPPIEILEKSRALSEHDVTSSGEPPNVRPVSLLFGPMEAIPVVGDVDAGPGVTNVDPDHRKVWVPRNLSNYGKIGMTIVGESMMPYLQPGDIAVFRESRTPRNGFAHLLKAPDGSFRMKLLRFKNGQFMLESINPNKEKFPDEPLDDLEITGLLVGWYRLIGSYEKLEGDAHGLRIEI